MEHFRVRLNCLDHYQAVPNQDFDPPVPRVAADKSSKDRPRVSVIRVFGATPTGQKVLMHVHGALQYTYIEYTGSLKSEDVTLAAQTLHLSIDHALAVSFRKNPYDGTNHYVARVSLVKGIPFYGYHVGYKFYLKIYLLNPQHMTRLSDLLRDGAIMKRALQPYESHLQYLAQWMCDYNLYGCAYIECDKFRFRGPIPDYYELQNPLHHWHDQSIPSKWVSDPAVWPKQSHCALELDVCVQNIVNRRSVTARLIHHDFVERVRPLPVQAKLMQSMAGLWKDETRRRKLRMGLKDASSSPFPPEVLVTMSADLRNTEDGGWIHEEEYRRKIVDLAAAESDGSTRQISFDYFVEPKPFEDDVQTALESVEELYPKNLLKMMAAEDDTIANGTFTQTGHVVVDENRVQNSSDEDMANLYGDDKPNGITHQSSEDDTDETSKDSPISEDRIDQPISSSEYENLGIHVVGEEDKFENEAFDVPPDLVNTGKVPSNIRKRARNEQYLDTDHEMKRQRPLERSFRDSAKRPRISDVAQEEIDQVSRAIHDQELPQDTFGDDTSNDTDSTPHPWQSESNLESPIDSSSQQSLLGFKVVKNPHNSERISQRTKSSQNSLKETVYGNVAVQPETPVKSTFGMTLNTPGSVSATFSTMSVAAGTLRFHRLAKPAPGQELLVFQEQAPRFEFVATTMAKEGLPDVIYQEAYYSNQDDVPGRPREYAGKEFKLGSNTLPFLPEFDASGTSAATYGTRQPVVIDQLTEQLNDWQRRKRCTISHWSIAKMPPSQADVERWVRQDSGRQEKIIRSKSSTDQLSQIDGPTQKNEYGFKYSAKQDSTNVQHETQYMSLMSLEVHVHTRDSLAPNPEYDQIACIFWCIQSDDDEVGKEGNASNRHLGILAVADEPGIARTISRSVQAAVEEKATELDALTRLVDIVREYDPDILTGYEVHNSSWGYLIERARLKYDLNYCDELSRMKSQSHGRFGKDDDRWSTLR